MKNKGYIFKYVMTNKYIGQIIVINLLTYQ